MNIKDICPKCKTGIMYQMGFDSCNWRCGLCGYKVYRPKPRPNIPNYSDRIAKLSQERQQTRREFDQSLQELRRSSTEYSRAIKAQREAEKNLRAAQKATRKQKKAEKKSSLGTIIAILFILWLLSKLL